MMLFVCNYQEKVIPASQKQTHFHPLLNILSFLFRSKRGGLREPECFTGSPAQLRRMGSSCQVLFRDSGALFAFLQSLWRALEPAQELR